MGTLADRLEQEAKEDGAQIVRAYARKGQLNKAADEALAELGLAGFRDVMRQTFAVDQPDDINLALPNSLWALRPKLVVTTNYDHVLKWSNPNSQVVTNSQRSNLADLSESTTDRPVVWHLHGHINDPDSLILAPEQ